MLQRLCTVISAVLGSAGCDITSPEPPYGVPCADIVEVVSGNVRHAATHAPIPGIQITLTRNDPGAGPFASTVADAAGRYLTEYRKCVREGTTYRVLAHDADGPVNGSFRDAEATVTFLSDDRVRRTEKTVDFDLDPQ